MTTAPSITTTLWWRSCVGRRAGWGCGPSYASNCAPYRWPWKITIGCSTSRWSWLRNTRT
jgi:hypothetical protein